MTHYGRYVIYADEIEEPYQVNADEYARQLQSACDYRGWAVTLEVRRHATGVGSGWNPRSLQDLDAECARDEQREREDIVSLANEVLERMSDEAGRVMDKRVSIGGYTFEWRPSCGSLLLLDGSKTSDEGAAEYIDADGCASWPTDEEVSAAVGTTVKFCDGGDHPDLPEALYHVVK